MSHLIAALPGPAFGGVTRVQSSEPMGVCQSW